jgi:hypothetical protein
MVGGLLAPVESAGGVVLAVLSAGRALGSMARAVLEPLVAVPAVWRSDS